YISLLISEKNFNCKKNILGVKQSTDVQKGIVDLNEFRRRLNIFISGDSSKNLLEGIDWSNMAITGGIMSAILPKCNPLMLLFSKNVDSILDSELNRFFGEYYSNSDIDIACRNYNIIEFIGH